MINSVKARTSFLALILFVFAVGYSFANVVVIPLDSSDSTGILYGRAPSSADKALLFKWPGTGVEVRTHDTDAGDAIFEVRIVNTNPSGGSSFYIANVGNSASSLTPGSSKK